jgi:hypothetical protein
MSGEKEKQGDEKTIRSQENENGFFSAFEVLAKKSTKWITKSKSQEIE